MIRNGGEHGIHMAARMDPQDLVDIGLGRLAAIEQSKRLVFKAPQDRLQPVGAFRMTGAGIVRGAGRVGKECGVQFASRIDAGPSRL